MEIKSEPNESRKKRVCLPGDISQSPSNDNVQQIKQLLVDPHWNVQALASCSVPAKELPNVQIKQQSFESDVMPVASGCAPAPDLQGSVLLMQGTGGPPQEPKGVADGRFHCDVKKVLRPGEFSSIFVGTFDGRVVEVERAKKIHVELAVAAEILKLNHLNVVSIFHCEEGPMFIYYATEATQASMYQLFLNDGNTKKFRGLMPTEKMVIQQLANGLEYIHSKQLVHGNIRPENVRIFVPPNGSLAVVKWAGFALFKQLDKLGGCLLTKAKGSLIWMAPELLGFYIIKSKSSPAVWKRLQRADVFAAGLTLFYYLTSGFHPFGQRNQSLSNMRQWIAPYLDKLPADHFARQVIVEVMMAKDPIGRTNWVNALKNCANGKNLNKKEMELFRLCSMSKLDKFLFARFCVLAADPEVDINSTQINTGFSFLMQLCISNRDMSFRQCFKALLQRDEIDVSIQDGEQTNALHLLARFNGEWTFEVITQLIQKGINTKITDLFGYNVLHYYCQGLNLYSQGPMLGSVLRFLLNCCSNEVNAQTNDGETALSLFCQHAKEEDLIEGIRFLAVECKADVNLKNLQGDNVLHLLVRHRKSNILAQSIRLLVKAGIDVNAKTKDGSTAATLFWERRAEFQNLTEFLQFLNSCQ